MYAEALRAKTLELRKARDPMAPFLVAVGARASYLAKNENPADPNPNDDQTLRAINSFIKNADDNLTLLAATPENPLFVKATAEKNLLRSFLPVEVSDDVIEQFVRAFIVGNPGEPKKMIGPIMKALDNQFGASLNKKSASGIVQKVVASV